jgi:signal transduction histidine kinase
MGYPEPEAIMPGSRIGLGSETQSGVLGPERGYVRAAGILIVGAAGILSLATAIECHSGSLQIDPGVSVLPSTVYGVVLWMWWPGVAYLIWRACEQWPATLSLSAEGILIRMAAGIPITLLHLALLRGTTRFMARHWSELAGGYGQIQFFEIGRFGLEFLLYALLWMTCGVLSLKIAAQKDAMHALELRQQLAATHLRALQMQLEPHFLFNTLNAITTLVELGRTVQAAEMLSRLNAILKKTLSRSEAGKVPLAQELEIVENYLAIEQVRFADRLRVEIKLDPVALNGLVPSFLMQPIVENAIRHGIANREAEGVIITSIERSSDRIQLRVRDNGPGRNGHGQSGYGIGLKNTEERLRHFYQKDFEMKVLEPESGGFEVSITIPYEKATG